MGTHPPAARPNSPTRSPPARSSSGRRRSSRSWSRTPSTPAPRRIAITVELGGKKLIRVEDDGEGMDAGRRAARARAPRDEQDRARRRSRRPSARWGSAARRCRSIASVSHFVLRTRARGEPTPAPRSASTAASSRRSPRSAAPEGTLVEVGDLFYNLPARRKFLKSDAAEAAQVSRIVTQLALGYPEVGFTLTSAAADAAASARRRRRSRIGSISSTASGRTWWRCRKEAGGLRITGYIAALAEQGPTRGPQNVFVNRRIVKDRTIAHAIIDAYSRGHRSRSAARRCTCSSRCRRTRVDVNVHPDEGRGALPRAVAGARGGAPGADGRARRRRRGAGADAGQSGGRRSGRPVDARPAQPALDLAAAERVDRRGAGRARRSVRQSAVERHAARGERAAARGHRTPRRRAGRIARAPGAQAAACRSGSSATRSSSPWTTRAWRSSISTSRTSACCSSASWSG